ncbi:MAG TPA: hypothetical protein VK528_08600 [Flavobacterium sp.]|nr:hypothetical protein [Flavobacterium sp.]
MKRTLLIAAAILSFFGLSSFQNTAVEKGHYTKVQVESFIREVFSEYSDELVFNSTSGRLSMMTGFLERFEIAYRPEYAGKKFKLLSTVALNNKYNRALTRDIAINPETFNPLKYRFAMSSQNIQLFRVDGTDFIIIIQPVK